MSNGSLSIPVCVSEVVEVNDLVKRFRFERLDGLDMPAFSGGSHVIVEMDIAGKKRLNPYSIMSDPADLKGYSISVRRDDEGRGGSVHMHKEVKVGMKMAISHPVNLFPLDFRAKKHLMIAGGIGITPFMAQIEQLSAMYARFELHYSVRSAALGSYAQELVGHHSKNVKLYHDDQDQRIDVDHLLTSQPLGTHLYICGPKGMISWVENAAIEAGWSPEVIHYEEFLAPEPGKPFNVTLAASNKEIIVRENQSLLEAIEEADVDAPYLCRGGACGQCETKVISSDGDFKHRDHWLEEDERKSGKKIMPCVSRFEGTSLVLDR